MIDIPSYGGVAPDAGSPPSAVEPAAPGWSDGSSTSTVDSEELTSAEVWLESDHEHDDPDLAAIGGLGAPSMASPDLDELWGDEPVETDTVSPRDPADVAPDGSDDPGAASVDEPESEAAVEAAVDPGWAAPTMPLEPPSDMPEDASEGADTDDRLSDEARGDGSIDEASAGEHPSDVILDSDALPQRSPSSPPEDEWLGTNRLEDDDGDDEAPLPSPVDASDAVDEDLEPADAAPGPEDSSTPAPLPGSTPPAPGLASPPPMGAAPPMGAPQSPPSMGMEPQAPPMTPPAPGAPPYQGYTPPDAPPAPAPPAPAPPGPASVYPPSSYGPSAAPPSYAPPVPPAPIPSQAPPAPPPASGYGQPGYPQTPAVPANPDPTYLGAAVQRVSPAARAAAKGALTLAAHLISGQRVEGVVIGRLKGATAAAVLTDQQLLLVNDQEWQPMVERLAVDSTLQVQGWDTGATVAMIFTSGGRPLELESIPDKQVAYEFAARIQARTGSQ